MIVFLAYLAMVPKAGAMNGSQYLMMIKSGASWRIFLAVRNHEMGLTELMVRWMVRFPGAGSSVYCDFPGKEMPGIAR